MSLKSTVFSSLASTDNVDGGKGASVVPLGIEADGDN